MPSSSAASIQNSGSISVSQSLLFRLKVSELQLLQFLPRWNSTSVEQCIFLCPLYDATSAVQCGDRSALQPRTFGTLFGVRSACYPLGFGEGTQRLQSRVGEWRVGAHAFNHHNAVADSVLRDTVQSCQVTQGSPSSAIKWPLKGEPPGSPVCSRCRTGLMCAGSPALSTLSGYTGERGLPAKSTR